MISPRLRHRHSGAPRRALQAALILLTVSFVSVSPTALADDERWFEVEIIAFARRTADSGAEHWPQNVELRYPARWQELRDPNALAATEENAAQDLHTRPADPLQPRFIPQPDPSRDAFYLLPRDKQQLRRHAEALGRDSRYRVLLHQTWRQPMLEQDRAPAILISGGDAYGSHHELEGSVTLYLSRFLHIQTQLWFSEFEVNYGQRPDAWSILPQHPRLVQASRPTEQETTPDTGFGATNAWNIELSGSQLSDSYLGDIPSSLGEPYLPKRIVALQQSRRMRSGELHYIDHPLVGLIVQITPFERPPASR